VSEPTRVRADLIDDDFDPNFGTRPDLAWLTERERLAVLLQEAGVRFGERGLGALSGMCLLASEELRTAEDDLRFSQRFIDVGSER
jgi:hypothetical protein